MPMKAMNVILLKSNDSTASKDRYVDFLLAQHSPLIQHVQQINLLKFSYQNLDLLKSKLFTIFVEKTNYEHYVHECFKCLIITSRQTVESIERALDVTVESDLPTLELDTRIENSQDKLLVYCVGQATANRFKQLVQALKKSNAELDKRLILRLVDDASKAEHKQNARELFRLIEQDYQLTKTNFTSTTGPMFKYALYPCSKIRKADLSNSLAEKGISFDELHTYDTTPSEIGIQTLKDALNSLHGVKLLVFFSPSGCDSVFKDPCLNSSINSDIDSFKFVSIGPSTSLRLKQYVDSSLICELAEPSPLALWTSIKDQRDLTVS